ncbi:MAG: hypothetical protein JOY55_07300 [Mycobacterium sp.]|nr:hypothetical protein [Mycobacterium sp.]
MSARPERTYKYAEVCKMTAGESWGVADIHLSANVADHSLCPGEMRRPAVER